MASTVLDLSSFGSSVSLQSVQLAAGRVHFFYRVNSSDPGTTIGFGRIDLKTGAARALSLSALNAVVAADNEHAQIAVSENGRFAAVSTTAALTAEDSNNAKDIYRIDLRSGAVLRASLSETGAQGQDRATNPAISANGATVAFSTASTLTPFDDGSGDVHVRDIGPSRLDNLGAALNGAHFGRWVAEDQITLSDDGRRAAFATLSAGVGVGVTEVILADRQTDAFTDVLASLRSQTRQGSNLKALGTPTLSGDGSTLALQTNGDGETFDGVFLFDVASGLWRQALNIRQPVMREILQVDLSDDGRFLAYMTRDARQVGDDFNRLIDVFVLDTATGRKVRASLDAAGRELMADVTDFDLSDDGAQLVFTTSGRGVLGEETTLRRVDGAGLWLRDDGAPRIVSVRGSASAETLEGGRWDDAIDGFGGRDRLGGGSGDDLLRGGTGADRLHGGTGDDTLLGGSGADSLIGGNGHDSFAFLSLRDSPGSSPDLILGFDGAGRRWGDVIDLSAIDARADLPGDQAFRLAATPGQGRLVIAAQGADSVLRAYVDDDRRPDFVVLLRDGSTRAGDYTAADFLL